MVALAAAGPAAAQVSAADPYEDTVFDGDYLAVGVGVAVLPSYAGSDDYVITPLPVLQGSLLGVRITPRAAGVGLDFVNTDGRVNFDLGVAARLRSDRAVQAEDEVVTRLAKLDRAIEVGPTIGFGLSRVLHQYDSLTVSVDAMYDVNGAHGGYVVSPSVSYLTPLNRGVAAVLSVSGEWGDGDFHDYYYRVTPAQSASVGGVLAAFQPDGSGFTRVSSTLLVGVDLDGDLTNGGFAVFGGGSYTRMLGDARRTPFTATRGDPDQFVGALGIGYNF